MIMIPRIFLRNILRQSLCLVLVALAPLGAFGQAPQMQTSLDPFTPSDKVATNPELETLLTEAQKLFLTDQAIDARAKLQQALQIAPNDYRPQMLLGTYYLSEVGHFQLADKYLTNALKLFSDDYGSDLDGTLNRKVWRINARLLSLISETKLNLDDYQGSLDILDRFARSYWDSWYPGSRAWVLMKLKRIDEAISIAQAGLLENAEPGKTYNVLGILLSLKNNRELALEAFKRAIENEQALGGSGQVATPLNNAGEVYRELFRDRYAEASWKRALALPEGCEHILTSLNLVILLVDELRLFEAERTLKDFEACYADKPLRSDTEHRALLALGKAKIALRSGDAERALNLATQAAERQQWFGKIGANQDDIEFAAQITKAQAIAAQIIMIRDRAYPSITDHITSYMKIPPLRLQQWWLGKQSRQKAVVELGDFEDLYIRHTDAMLEYPTLGFLAGGFSSNGLNSRINHIIKSDDRQEAHKYYQLYLAINYFKNGDSDEAERILKSIYPTFHPFDRLARAEILSYLIKIELKKHRFWQKAIWGNESMQSLISELFMLSPAMVRYGDFKLPARFVLTKEKTDETNKLEQLLQNRFYQESQARYQITVTQKENNSYSLILEDTGNNTVITSTSGVTNSAAGLSELYNSFVSKVFSHHIDHESEALPQLDIIRGKKQP